MLSSFFFVKIVYVCVDACDIYVVCSVFIKMYIIHILQITIIVKIPNIINPVRVRGIALIIHMPKHVSINIDKHANPNVIFGYIPTACFSVDNLILLSPPAKKYSRNAPKTVKILPIELMQKYIVYPIPIDNNNNK